MDFRGVDTDLGWINREFQKLRREIEGLRSEKRAAATTIGSGGLVVDGGDITMLDADGDVIFRIGEQEHGDRGVTIAREDGSVALEVRKIFGPDIGQAVAIRDSTGTAVLETDSLFQGLRAPYLDHTFQPYAVTTGTPVTCGPHGFERTSTSNAFETVFVYDGKRQNPFLHIRVAVRPSDTTTAAEVRVVDLATSAPLPLFLSSGNWLGTIAAGAANFAVAEATALVAAVAGGQNQRIRLGVQVRRSAGSGSLTVAVPTSIGG